MGLKQSVVIVSEFTFKTKSGSGSRGSTPGAYALDYMARNDAVEALTPVKQHAQDAYDARYRMREDAVLESDNLQDVKDSFRKAREGAGVAFGYGQVSLSRDELVAACDDIQHQFDNGKTVFKTVLSFDGDYMKSHGLVDDDFVHSKKGDYRGHVDQMKMRMGIMSGLDKLSDRGFDDLQYVGALQFDTNHVHCHLAMVDRGEGRVINSKTGAQKGKLSKRDFEVVRHGIDCYFDQHRFTKHLSPSMYNDVQNVQCYVKGYTHDLMKDRALPQFLMACLPEDRSLWRASNKSQAMRKPNALVREYVESVLSRPDSGYGAALGELSARLERRDLDPSGSMYQQFYRSGQHAIVEDCMNGVYKVLREIPEQDLRVQTPMLSRMSMDFESMAATVAGNSGDKVAEFGFKLRSYSGRQDFHRKESVKYHEAVAGYESQGNISDSARAVIDFMRFEEEYNAMLLAKYQHFMVFLPSEEDYRSELDKLRRQKDLLARFEAMQRDEKMAGMTVNEAEKYGKSQYDIKGGGLRVIDQDAFNLRGERIRAEFTASGQELDYRLSLYGLGLFESEDGKVLVQKDIKYPFDDVKALDLHHLQYDFGYDVDISKPNVDAFLSITQQRVELFNKAADYLERSGQGDMINQFAVRDIQKMSEMAETLQKVGRLPSAVDDFMRSNKQVTRNRLTVSLDRDYSEIMASAVHERVSHQAGDGDI